MNIGRARRTLYYIESSIGMDGLALTERHGAWGFHCPGCDITHFIKDDGTNFFRGDYTNPTFEEVIQSTTRRADGRKIVCHLNIIHGHLCYLPSCTHALADTNRPMTEF